MKKKRISNNINIKMLIYKVAIRPVTTYVFDGKIRRNAKNIRRKDCKKYSRRNKNQSRCILKANKQKKILKGEDIGKIICAQRTR